MRNIKIVLEYDGSSYYGWQRQPRHPTVQELVEDGLHRLFRNRIKVRAAGRTDTGVHAKGQVISFLTSGSIPVPAIKPALNSYLPADIKVKKAQEVRLDFHAQRCALSRLYRYIIYNHPFPSPFYRNFSWHVPFSLQIENMREGSRHLIGSHDFSSFLAQGSPVYSPVREIKKVVFFVKGRLIVIYVSADSFLYRMVRNIIGTLAEVGRKRLSPIEVKKILDARDRAAGGPTAPPRGLCLVRVRYPSYSLND